MNSNHHRPGTGERTDGAMGHLEIHIVHDGTIPAAEEDEQRRFFMAQLRDAGWKGEGQGQYRHKKTGAKINIHQGIKTPTGVRSLWRLHYDAATLPPPF